MYLYYNLKKYIKKCMRKYRGLDEIDYDTLKNMRDRDKNILLIDVRSKQEFNEEHLEGSKNISLYDFERGNFKINNKDTVIILYCSVGKRSKRVQQILKKLGYKNVYVLQGGLENI